MIRDLYKLQNGTDIRGIAVENNERKVNLTEKEVYAIGIGFIKWLKQQKNVDINNIKVAIGTDSRISGPHLKESLIKAITDMGCDVYDCSMATTPAMFMSTILEKYNCDGSIMITASHLPYFHNGMKFFTKSGGCEKIDISNILEFAEEDNTISGKIGKTVQIDLIDDYAKHLVSFIRSSVNSKENYDKPLEGLNIIVDAGNGAGGFFAEKVLQELGANTEGSQFLNPDGLFPNHVPNPENKEAMESIRNAVIENKSDLGIIFDTDVDRAAVVGSDGCEINRNALIALIGAIVLEEHPGSTIVTDSITSNGLTDFIQENNGVHHRFKRGYKNVINESKKLNEQGVESYLAIETSGHAALKENYFLDDGAYLVAKILVKTAKLHKEGKNIKDLINTLKMPQESIERRLKIDEENFKEYGQNLINELEKSIQDIEGWSLPESNFEGIKVNCDKGYGEGWFLLRLSLHEPLLALNIESDVENGTKVISDKLKYLLSEYKSLDLSLLNIK